MAREIRWTKRGFRSLKRVVRYLEEEWNEKVTTDFLVKVFHTLNLLSRNPSLGTSEFPEKGIRGMVITKHNRLFYRTTKTSIIVLNVYDNRSGKRRKKY